MRSSMPVRARLHNEGAGPARRDAHGKAARCITSGRPLPRLRRCCAACETITATSCLCSSGARAALLEWLQGQGSAVELAFVQGAASILHTACALGAIHPCLTNAGGM